MEIFFFESSGPSHTIAPTSLMTMLYNILKTRITSL